LAKHLVVWQNVLATNYTQNSSECYLNIHS